MAEDEKIRFQAGGQKYEISISEKEDFIKDFPDAIELKRFVADNQKYDIPVAEVEDFLKDFPDAKPLSLGKPLTVTQPGGGGGLPLTGTPGADGGRSPFGMGSIAQKIGQTPKVKQPIPPTTTPQSERVDQPQIPTMPLGAPEMPPIDQLLKGGDANAMIPQVQLKSPTETYDTSPYSGNIRYNPLKDLDRRKKEVENIEDKDQRAIATRDLWKEVSDFANQENDEIERLASEAAPNIEQMTSDYQRVIEAMQQPDIPQDQLELMQMQADEIKGALQSTITQLQVMDAKYRSNANLSSQLIKGSRALKYNEASPVMFGLQEAWNGTVPALLKTAGGLLEAGGRAPGGMPTLTDPYTGEILNPTWLQTFGSSLISSADEMEGGYESTEAQKSILDDVNAYNIGAIIGSAISSIAIGAATGGAGATGQMVGFGSQIFGNVYQQAKDAGLTPEQAGLFASIPAIVGAKLAPYGVESIAGKLVNPSAKAMLKEAVKNVGKEGGAKAVLNYAKEWTKNVMIEGATGAVESAVQYGEEAAAQNLLPNVDFGNDETLKGFAEAVGEGAVGEAIGGGALGLFLSARPRKKLSDVAAESLSDPKKEQQFLGDLKALLINGDITQQEFDQVAQQYEQVKAASATVPSTVTNVADRSAATELILEQQDLQQQIEQTNPAMVAPLEARLNEVNSELGAIAEASMRDIGQVSEPVEVKPKKIKAIAEIVAETKEKAARGERLEAAKQRFKEAQERGESIRLRKEEDAKAEIETQRIARDAEVEQIAQIRPDLTDQDILLADVPASVDKVLDRMDAGIPSDPVQVQEAIDALDKKFQSLEAYKKDPKRTHASEQIDEVIDLLSDTKTELQLYQEQISGYERDQTTGQRAAEPAAETDQGKPETTTTEEGSRVQEEPTAEVETEEVVETPQETVQEAKVKQEEPNLTQQGDNLNKEPNAVQIESTAEVPIQSEAGTRQEVEGGTPEAEPQETAKEGEQEKITPKTKTDEQAQIREREALPANRESSSQVGSEEPGSSSGGSGNQEVRSKEDAADGAKGQEKVVVSELESLANQLAEEVEREVGFKEKAKQAAQRRKEAFEKVKAARRGLAINPYAQKRQQALAEREFLDALVYEMKIYIQQGAKTVGEYAKQIGESVDDLMRDAWNVANGADIPDRYKDAYAQIEDQAKRLKEDVEFAVRTGENLQQSIFDYVINTPWYRSLTAQERQAVDEDLLQQYGYINPQNAIPTQDSGQRKGQVEQATIGKRITESDKFLPRIREGLKEKGIDYVVKSKDITSAEADNIIDGFEDAGNLDYLAQYVMNPANAIEPAVKVMLLAKLKIKYAKESAKAKGVEKIRLEDMALDLAYASMNYGKELGRGVDALKVWKDLSGENPDIILRDIQRNIDRANQQALSGHQSAIEQIKKAFDQLTSTPEGQALIDQVVSEQVSDQLRKSAKKRAGSKVIDQIDQKLADFQKKIRSRTYDATIGVPLSVLDASITIIRKALYLGKTISEAVQDGIDYIKSRHSGPFNEEAFRKDFEEEFKDIKPITPPSKSESVADAAEKLKKTLSDLDAMVSDPDAYMQALEEKRQAAQVRAAKKAGESTSEMIDLIEKIKQRRKDLAKIRRDRDALSKQVSTRPGPLTREQRLNKRIKELDDQILDADKYIKEQQEKLDKKNARIPKTDQVVALEAEVKLRKKIADAINATSGLSDKQRKSILIGAIDAIVNNGYLSDVKFRNEFAKVLGLKSLSDADMATIKAQVAIISQAAQAQAAYMANPTTQNAQAYNRAAWNARVAAQKLNPFIGNQMDIYDKISSYMSGALLSTKTVVLSGGSNIVQAWSRFLTAPISTSIDWLRYQVAMNTAIGNKIPYFQRQRFNDSLAGQKGYYKGGLKGGIEGVRQLYFGSMPSSSSDTEFKTSLHPGEAAIRVFNSLTGKQKQSLLKNLSDFSEATLGLIPETMFRLLNLTDKPARRAVEEGVIREQVEIEINQLKRELLAKASLTAEEQSLLDDINSGLELQRRLAAPSEQIMETAESEGESAVFQQKNIITQALEKLIKLAQQTVYGKKVDQSVSKLPKGLLSFVSGMVKILKVTNMPFVNMPANWATEIVLMANPSLALGAGVVAASRGDVRMANRLFGKAAFSAFILLPILRWLVLEGVINGSGDDDSPEERALTYQYKKGYNRINISLLNRILNGQGNDGWKEGDYSQEYYQMGIAGALGSVMADANKDGFDVSWLNQQSNTLFSSIKTGLDMPMVQGTNMLIEALSSGDLNKFQRITVNMGRVATAPLAPAVISKSILANDKLAIVKDAKDPETVKWLWNDFKDRWGYGQSLPAKYTVWGDTILKTPEGSDPFVYQLFSFSKGAYTPQDKVGAQIYELVSRLKEQKDKESIQEALPSLISQKKFDVVKKIGNKYEQQTIELSQEQLWELNRVAGILNKKYAQSLVLSDWWSDKTTTDQMKAKALSEAYKYARKAANKAFAIKQKLSEGVLPEEFLKQVPELYPQ